jgi:hypothetical protein
VILRRPAGMSRIDWRAIAPVMAAQIRERQRRRRDGLEDALPTFNVLLGGKEWQVPKGATLE